MPAALPEIIASPARRTLRRLQSRGRWRAVLLVLLSVGGAWTQSKSPTEGWPATVAEKSEATERVRAAPNVIVVEGAFLPERVVLRDPVENLQLFSSLRPLPGTNTSKRWANRRYADLWLFWGEG